jgi:DNA-binding GntR family transcriptional regulator
MKHEHEEVVATLEAGDVEGLKACIESQILRSRNRILEAIMAGDMPSVQLGG